jgi:hypothetical protein
MLLRFARDFAIARRRCISCWQFAAAVASPGNDPQGNNQMRLVAYILAVILIIIAVIYFLMPADSLPTFFPGHEPGLTRIRMKHGIAAGAAGVILFLVGWFVGRSRA